MTEEECYSLTIPRADTDGYDPDWKECFYETNVCVCFHPNQGYGNPIYTEVKELPKTGGDMYLFGIFLVGIIVALSIIIKRRNKK